MLRTLLATCSVTSRRFLWKKHLGDMEKILIPTKPCPSSIDLSKVEPAPELNVALKRKLEKVSLLRFETEDHVKMWKDAVAHANQISLVDVSGVEPMYFVHEDEDCPLREDEPEPTNRKDILKNAAVIEDGAFFVTPPGNVPLEDIEIAESRPQKK
ncbi:hypothetical protein L596_014341 [Steinernema carpocapsae]|uniref:Glutamyl-tRNA(Gln) amidotransferase subunit C, mitochondrial n=1 Tax=Steinernema carpocapsae TaxID=34508 RepID=A0A4U5NBM2_STECR|nr:hypothetical protein L596_014341 [Steinernema carpocapsae]